MQEKRPIIITCTCYMIFMILGIIFWIPFPDTVHFIGASSLEYTLLLALFCYNKTIICATIFWIVGFPIGVCLCFIVAKKTGKYKAFLSIIAIELFVSFAELLLQLLSHNYTDLFLAFLGLAFRVLFYILMYCEIRSKMFQPTGTVNGTRGRLMQKKKG